MPRPTQDQRDQVSRYAEILRAQQDTRAERAALASETAWGAATSLVLTVIMLLVAFWFTSPGSRAFGVAVGVALCSSLLGPVVTGLFLRRSQLRQRRAAERLVSLQHEDEFTSVDRI
ncbi:hypothetical protein ENSA5_37850 [Enhygromyxa salina]|uniref:Uncharacterized protein n=1 Tax=Enhygromyxa salina TaxID=215803 RepID=A0A2S9XS09_9BACT|nr:hypothetical protein [Enhygromyxa salina]PRP95652.1 hypothetical protein ENSA5_37850 [Enhygromyxa salina]